MTQISSPCIKLCAIDPVSGLCTGCGRTMAEIGRWGALSEPQRLAIMATLKERRQLAATQRRSEGLKPSY